MGILGIILAIVGLGILIIGVFALVGAGTTASALGLGDAATTVLSGIGSFIASWWQLFAVILIIGLIAYVARRGTGSGGLGFERAAGAAEGITKGLTSEGESSSVTSGPSSDPPTTTPTGGGDTDDSTSSSDSSTNVNVQQQQQQMQQLLQAIVMNNLSQTPAGTYAPQQQQQQQMIVGGSLSPNVYNTFLQQIQMTQVNQQQMINQLMQFIMQKGYDGVSDKVLVQFMKQVMDVDIDIDMGGKGDKINVQINQLIQKINIQRFEQNIEQIVQEISITNNQFVYIESLIEILIAIEEGAFVKEGDIIIIDAKQTVEIKAEILINFLEILQIVKTWELKQMIVALIEMEQVSWEVRIEQLIVIYRNSEKGESYGSGDRWKIFLNRINQSNLPQNMKRSFEKIGKLKDGALNNRISPESLVLFRRVMMQTPLDTVKDKTDMLVNYLNNKNYDSLTNEALINATEYLRDHQPAVKNYKNKEGFSNNMADNSGNLGALEQSVKQLIEEMQNELQIDQTLVAEDKEIINDLGDALQKIDKWAPVINDLLDVQLPGNNSKVSGEDFFHQMQEVVQAHQELQSKEASRQLMNDMEDVEADLEEAIRDLEDKEGKQKQEIEQEVNIERRLSKIEDAYLGSLQEGLSKLKQYKGE